MSTPQGEIKAIETSVEQRLQALEAPAKTFYERHVTAFVGVLCLVVGFLAGRIH